MSLSMHYLFRKETNFVRSGERKKSRVKKESCEGSSVEQIRSVAREWKMSESS